MRSSSIYSQFNDCIMAHDGLITVGYVLHHKTHKYLHLCEEISQVSSLLYANGIFSLPLALRKRMARLSQKMKRVREVFFLVVLIVFPALIFQI